MNTAVFCAINASNIASANAQHALKQSSKKSGAKNDSSTEKNKKRKRY